MGRLVPVGHNVQFDIRFINWVLDFEKKRDMFEWHHPNFIDTNPLAKLAFGIKGDEKFIYKLCYFAPHLNSKNSLPFALP